MDEYLSVKIEVSSDTEEPEPGSQSDTETEVVAQIPEVRPRVALRDVTKCNFQDAARCASCYKRLPLTKSRTEFLDRLWAQRRRTGRHKKEVEDEGSLTVVQALELVLDVKRVAHMSKVILDETHYALCTTCTGFLQELCLSYSRFARGAKSPSYVHSMVAQKSLLWTQVKAKAPPPEPTIEEDEDDVGKDHLEDAEWTEEGDDFDLKPPLPRKRKRGRPRLKKERSVSSDDERNRDEPNNAESGSDNPADTESNDIDRKKSKRRRRTKGRDHKCPECPAILVRTDHLRRHMKVHAEHNFRCETCGAGFKHQSNLNHHLAHVHNLPVPPKEPKIPQSYPCPRSLCTSVLAKAVHLRQHLKEKHGMEIESEAEELNDENSCDEGSGGDVLNDISASEDESGSESNQTDRPKGGRTKSKRKRSPKSGTTSTKVRKAKGGRYEYECQQCPAVFQRTNGLRSHMKVHAEHNVNCEHCGAGFRLQLHLHQHLAHVHSLPVKPKRIRKMPDPSAEPKSYPCPQPDCTSVLKKTSHLNRHLKEKHGLEPEPTVPSPCPVCPRVLRSASLLARHLDSRHRPTVWLAKYECPDCGRKCRDKFNMRDHMLSHTPEKPFMCHMCGFTTKRSGQLANHVTHVHGTGARPYTCSICGQSFKKGSHLRDHERSHLPSDHRPFVCTLPACGKAYRTARNLRAHMVLHTEQRFPCGDCGRVFTRPDNLRVHHNTVHLGKPGRAPRSALSTATPQRRRKKSMPKQVTVNLSEAEDEEEEDERNGGAPLYVPQFTNLGLGPNYHPLQAHTGHGGYYYG